ncbi:MAG TPA: hypothetical protein VKA70_10195 [Blastocatellia bacterium]|nr:hypothetical protein [Blastocatellia bacterium]
MISVPFRAGLSARVLLFSLCLILAPALTSCSESQSDAQAVILEHIKTHGGSDVKEVKIDFFHTDKQAPDKAYAAVTTTYTFGSGSGELQREYSGYILKREGGQWVVEENTNYVKDADKAAQLLKGKAKKPEQTE